ncbi:MAG: pilus assembly protein PilM [bacterium]
MKVNFLKKLFYLPNYLSLPVAGIEICNRSIKYIEFFNKKGVFSIKNFGEVLLSPNIVRDGDILNRNALIKALTEVKNHISTDFVKVSIPEEKTYIFDVQIPKEAKSNIRETLEFKIEENAPLKLGESYFEYEIVDDKKSGKDITLNVSVIPRRVISEYAEIFDQIGIYPLSYEIESKMIADSVIQKGDERNSIIINIKDDSTVLVAVIDGFVRITSSVSVGESAIRESLLKTGLFSDELVVGKFFENDFSFETTYTKESYASLVNVFSVLKDEVEKFNEYIINKFSNTKTSPIKSMDKIILCGRSVLLPGLAKHINQNINAEVVFANTWSNVFDIKEHTSNMKFYDSLSFVTPIGLIVSSSK